MGNHDLKATRDFAWLAWVIVIVAVGGMWFYYDYITREPERRLEAQRKDWEEQRKELDAAIIARYGSMDAFNARSQITVTLDEWGRDGNYFEIKGTVTNKSKFTCSYWRVAYEFLDKKGKVVHAGWTNSSTTLRPGASEKWDSSEKGFEPEPDSLRAWVEDSRLN